jgi:hypothetical protein
MKVKHSRLLVVDASVACSAGETEHPVSSCCRNALLSIRDICHRVIMTEPIRSEWDRHKSRFTRKWFMSMVAKKIQRSMGMRVDLAERALTGLSATEQESLEKDLCLIEAACDGDGIVVTRDDEVVKIWQKCQGQFHLAKPITWINPVTDDIGVFERL